jgi:hypothetical protein
MSLGIGFFFGFDNTPTQLGEDLYGSFSGPSLVVPPPTPPPLPNNAASLQAEENTQREGLLRKTFLKTIHAGANGGFRAAPSTYSVAQTGGVGPGHK